MDFLTGSSTLDAIANKYSRGLSEHYDLIHPGTISSIAEEKLRILAEIEAAENAVVILNAYIYRRYKYHRDNRPRKISSLFKSEFSGSKVPIPDHTELCICMNIRAVPHMKWVLSNMVRFFLCLISRSQVALRA